jgi:hypothetical protein
LVATCKTAGLHFPFHIPKPDGKPRISTSFWKKVSGGAGLGGTWESSEVRCGVSPDRRTR